MLNEMKTVLILRRLLCMFEEHVITLDLSLEENKGEKLWSWGDAGACCSFQTVGEGCGFLPLEAVREAERTVALDNGPCWGSGQD